MTPLFIFYGGIDINYFYNLPFNLWVQINLLIHYIIKFIASKCFIDIFFKNIYTRTKNTIASIHNNNSIHNTVLLYF